MTFTTPLLLVLLLVLPVIWYTGWPRQRFRRNRDISALLLRSLIVLLLVLSISGAQLILSSDKLAVVFLIDVSDSISPAARDAELEYVRQALPAMGADDVAGVVVFGSSPVVERSLSNVREIDELRSVPSTGNTDIAEAIRLGLGLFPADAAKRLVILSDGRATVGDTQAAAELSAATGVEISYITFQPEPAPEVLVTDVRVPSAVNAGQEFDLGLTVQAETATPATITVLASGAIIHREEVQLREGLNNYTLPLEGGSAGFKDFRIQVDPRDNDGFYQNNQLSAFSRVVGSPTVLVLYTTPDEIQYLRPALEENGLNVDALTPDQLPTGLVTLAQYDAIILANVPATRLSNQRMNDLESYVKDLGGGLIAIGGPNSYGPGGYFDTPLEEMLPLEMQVRDQQRLPQLTIAYVIDRSGSMGIPGPSGVENLELAKEAIIRSIDFLQPTDRAGVVSFDTSGYWIAEIQPVFDRRGLQQLVATLRAGGGTDVLAGMNLVAESIASDSSDRKHIILLTDGGTNPRGLVQLSERLNDESGVTTSVIAIGGGASQFLQDMAQAGGGNYHAVELVEQIPTIFTLETVLATRSYILEEPFLPQLSASSPIMDGITAAPQLLGYVATSPKLTSQIILRGPAPYNDPLLASWQYGLGRSVAFTSDATSRWGANWVDWSNFVRFWGQTVRWTITEGASNNIETRVVMEGEQAKLVIDARGNNGEFLNGLNLQLSLVDPDTQANLLPLQQVAPGRYEAVFTPDTEGAYILHIVGGGTVGGQDWQFDQTTGWVMSYSPEYGVIDTQNAGETLLADLAMLTGGRDLQTEPGEVFTHNLLAQNATTPIWPLLLFIALLLLPFDIAIRRLIVTRTDLLRLRQFFQGRQLVLEGTSERLSSLMGAKERGRQRAEESSGAVSTISALRSRKDEARTTAQPETPAPEKVSPREASKPRYTPPKTPAETSASNVAGQLLKRRKDRDDDPE